jgi:hypothetical protein
MRDNVGETDMSECNLNLENAEGNYHEPYAIISRMARHDVSALRYCVSDLQIIRERTRRLLAPESPGSDIVLSRDMPGGPNSLGMVRWCISADCVSSECDAHEAHVSPSFCKLGRQPQAILMCYNKVVALSACGTLDRH